MDTQLLILSDGKPGHLNQSIALARHLGCDYRVIEVGFRGRWAKALSYAADHCHLLSERLLSMPEIAESFAAVVSTGSETYYANRLLAQRLGIKSVAIMLPRGYRYDFDLIIAQDHDRPPVRENILQVPINLTWVEPQGLWQPQSGQNYLALIIGGNSPHSTLDADLLRQQIETIRGQFPNYLIWLTTSRRTPPELEKMLQRFEFDRAAYFSREASNPIPDMLAHCDYVFLTPDSSSMISEAVSYGKGCVEILPCLEGFQKKGKMGRFIKSLEDQGCLHLFDGQPAACNHKQDLQKILFQSGLQALVTDV